MKSAGGLMYVRNATHTLLVRTVNGLLSPRSRLSHINFASHWYCLFSILLSTLECTTVCKLQHKNPYVSNIWKSHTDMKIFITISKQMHATYEDNWFMTLFNFRTDIWISIVTRVFRSRAKMFGVSNISVYEVWYRHNRVHLVGLAITDVTLDTLLSSFKKKQISQQIGTFLICNAEIWFVSRERNPLQPIWIILMSRPHHCRLYFRKTEDGSEENKWSATGNVLMS